MADDNQEKQLPASQQKLRKAREKGQVASSQDFVSAAVVLALALWLLVEGEGLIASIAGIFREAAAAAASGRGIDGQTIALMFTGLFGRVGLLMAIGGFAGIAANIAHKGGLVFSMTPLAVDMSRLSISKGFGRMFGARHMSSLGISLVQLMLWFLCAGLVFWSFAPAILNAPLCGAACVYNAGASALARLLVFALIIIVVAALIDLPLQVFMFKREMRMSHQERKQEAKETEGAPEFERARRESFQAILRSGSNVATVVITSSNSAVALRFHPETAPVPVVVAKGLDASCDRIVDAARRLGVPVWPDPELSRRLMRYAQVGATIPPSEFGAVAPHILRTTRG